MSRHGESLKEAWDNLENGINQVFERPKDKQEVGTGATTETAQKTVNLTRERYMLLYTAVHNFCTQTGRGSAPTRNLTQGGGGGASLVGSELYNKVIVFLKGHCAMLLQEGLPKVGDDVLQFFSDSWRLYTFSAKVLNNLFAYLNRHWVQRAREEGQKDVFEVYKLTLVIWRESLFIPLQTQIFEGVMGLIERERNGEKVNTQLIRNITDCFVALGLEEDEESDVGGVNGQLAVYKKYFEEGFLQRTEEYYIKESTRFLQENPVTEYMKKAMQRLEQEATRVVSYLHESTRDDLAKKCEETLIKAHEERLQGEFQVLLNDEKTDDLSRMYLLMARIKDGLTPLRELLEKHVCAQGMAAIEKVEDAVNDAKAYVTCLLSVHKRYSDMVETAFQNDASFVQALDRACKKFVNKNIVTKQAKSTAKSPELLAKYCDSLLKKGNKNAADGGEIEKLLEGVMVVFKYLEDNDVFQKFYSKMLAKRLVYSNSASDDAESSMISKLKQACGFEWTSKFQRMFQDVGISKDLMKKFEGTSSTKAIKDFSIMVLTTGSWPFSQQHDELVLPAVLESCRDKFKIFYLQQHSGRVLKWLFHLSKGELRTTYTVDAKSKKPCQYTLQANTTQMSILMKYNDTDTYSFDEISASVGIPKESLTGVMEVLCKTKLITKTDDSYALNMGFKNKKLRVNINMPIKAEAKAESEQLHKTIDEDRKMLIQATVVKIMKTRINMNHTTLITECITQLKERFKPKIPMLKKQIDVLMEKGYMARVENTRDQYQYLA
eukprot:m.199442 g.199442  ORF g.199442 m.199442 type:complete len:776 (-) comp32734_c0_seq1:2185-4512(-)